VKRWTTWSLGSLILVSAVVLAAAQAPETAAQPAKTGHASLTLGGPPLTYALVDGNFMEGYGFHTITLTYSKDGKPTGDNLGIGLMIQKPGAVDLNQPMGNGIQVRVGMTIYSYEKGKSQCTITVTDLTATAVTGTAECPVLNELNGSRTQSLTSVKFTASTK
jgi:hypothetical protein